MMTSTVSPYLRNPTRTYEENRALADMIRAMAAMARTVSDLYAEQEANRVALIVRAVNERDELIAALAEMVDAYKDRCEDDEQPASVRRAMAALAKAQAP